MDLKPLIAFFRERGANCARVWPYVRFPDGTGWETPDNETIIALVRFLRAQGLYTYLTLFTDSQPPEGGAPNRIEWAKRLVNDCAAAGLDSLLFEIGNEPQINKHIDTHQLKATLDASGFLYTNGEYNDSREWFGRFGDQHPPRENKWPRCSHDLYEFYNGGGPSYPEEPATHVPWIAGEPIKPNQMPRAPETDEQTHEPIDHVEDCTTFTASVGLLGAGAIFHYEGGKWGRMPDADESACADAWFRGLRAFPEDAWFAGPYERIDEHGETLRTYKRGPYVVRIRPVSGPILQGELS